MRCKIFNKEVSIEPNRYKKLTPAKTKWKLKTTTTKEMKSSLKKLQSREMLQQNYFLRKLKPRTKRMNRILQKVKWSTKTRRTVQSTMQMKKTRTHRDSQAQVKPSLQMRLVYANLKYTSTLQIEKEVEIRVRERKSKSDSLYV